VKHQSGIISIFQKPLDLRIMKKSFLFLALAIFCTSVLAQGPKGAQGKKPVTQGADQNQNANQNSSSTAPTEDPTQLLVGTWLFVSAKAGTSDVSNDYPLGKLNGKARKMTLLADGSVFYEPEVVTNAKLMSAKWKVEKNETTGAYSLVFTHNMMDGSVNTKREKILTITKDKLVFGRVIVEYVRSM